MPLYIYIYLYCIPEGSAGQCTTQTVLARDCTVTNQKSHFFV